MRGVKNLKNLSKNQKSYSMVNQLPGLFINNLRNKSKMTQRQCCICYYGLFNEVWPVVDALQSNQLDILAHYLEIV